MIMCFLNSGLKRDVAAVSQFLNVLITSGGTIAPIDDVRILTNRSTGRFAKSLAEARLSRGANVTYIATTPQTAGPLEEPARRFDAMMDPAEMRQTLMSHMARVTLSRSTGR